MQPSLGILLNAEYPIAELVELGRLSEQLGYRCFWHTDVRFLRESYLGLAAVAAKTSRILLGPGVTDPYTRHPAITTVTVATLDEMSGGRALLGLGAGGTTLQQIGIDWRLPVAALRETVDVFRRLMRSEEVTVDGKVITLTKGKLQFAPLRSEVPVYFATHGAQVTKLAGEIADGVLLANILSPKDLAFYLDKLAEGRALQGRPPESIDVCVRLEACISDDESGAMRVMKRRVASRLTAQYPHWEYLSQMGITLPEPFVEAAARKAPPSEAMQALPDEVVRHFVLAGKPDEVARQVARVLIPGVTQICIRPHSLPGQSVGPVIEAFARDVMPTAIRLASSATPAAT